MANTCLSGGAAGADVAWGQAAMAAGHTVIHWTFTGHRSKAPANTLHFLASSDLRMADPYLMRANDTLQRRWPVTSEYVANLLRRNWLQVATANACYAVASLEGKMVTGGTAWAVQMFVDEHKRPAFVFCQQAEGWFEYDGRLKAITKPPIPTGTYAGIGSRDLRTCGLNAIQAAFR